jgi:hypothetical protein
VLIVTFFAISNADQGVEGYGPLRSQSLKQNKSVSSSK